GDVAAGPRRAHGALPARPERLRAEHRPPAGGVVGGVDAHLGPHPAVSGAGAALQRAGHQGHRASQHAEHADVLGGCGGCALWRPPGGPERPDHAAGSQRRHASDLALAAIALSEHVEEGLVPRTIVAIYFSLLALAAACERTETPTEPTLDAQLRQDIGRWGVIPIGPVPAQPEALVDLGQALMFDKILSGNRDVACATCHHPSTHEGDGLSLSIGTGGTGLGPSRTLGPGRQFVRRNAPSLLNDGLGLFYLFWDGRVARFMSSFNGGPLVPGDVPNLLSAQAMLPVLDRREMRGEPGDRDVFGAPNELAQIADSDSAAVWQALMQRLLTIPEYVAKFNRAFPNTPTSALPVQQFYQFAFRVAPLRNVELTAPYMHDGAFPTLDAVVRHYNDVPLTLTTYDASQLDPALRSTYHGDAATTDSVIRTLDFRLQT